MPATLNFQPHKKGTTMLQQDFKITEATDGPPNLNGAIIRMQLKTSPTGPVEHEFNNIPNEGGITIDNHLECEFHLNKQIIDIPAFDYLYGIQIEFSNGDKDEFFQGIFPVFQDIVN